MWLASSSSEACDWSKFPPQWLMIDQNSTLHKLRTEFLRWPLVPKGKVGSLAKIFTYWTSCISKACASNQHLETSLNCILLGHTTPIHQYSLDWADPRMFPHWLHQRLTILHILFMSASTIHTAKQSNQWHHKPLQRHYQYSVMLRL